MASGFTKLQATFSDLLPTDFVVDADMEVINEIWDKLLETGLTNIDNLKNFKKPDRIPSIWLHAVADNLNIEYTQDTSDEVLRRLIYRAVIQNKLRNTVTDILNSIEAITGVAPTVGLRPAILEGFDQDNTVAEFAGGVKMDQLSGIMQTILFYQGEGFIPLVIDLQQNFDADILLRVYQVVARKKIALSVISVGYTDNENWVLLKEIWSTDLDSIGYGAHIKRY